MVSSTSTSPTVYLWWARFVHITSHHITRHHFSHFIIHQSHHSLITTWLSIMNCVWQCFIPCNLVSRTFPTKPYRCHFVIQGLFPSFLQSMPFHTSSWSGQISTQFFADVVAGWPIFVSRKQADGIFTSAGTIHALTIETAAFVLPQFLQHQMSNYLQLNRYTKAVPQRAESGNVAAAEARCGDDRKWSLLIS